jgi:cAMP-dependent protein kinase regulator
VRAASASRVGLLERDAVAADLGRLPNLRRALEQAWRRRALAAGIYQIDIFQALSDEARARLLERFERVEVPPASVLATEGEPGDTFTFIRAGEAQLHLDPALQDAPPTSNADPAAPSTATLGPGDYLGELALVGDAPHGATVTTAAGLSAMQLTRAQFEDALGPLPGQLEAAQAAVRRRGEGPF